jgi:DNA repair exonuclease SbcCD nuclease subunit
LKIAIVSDAHLFQTFSSSYDSVKDFGLALEKIKSELDPDLLFLAGDMFDAKKTETLYVRHYEGEGQMIRVRETLRKFAKPVYAIRGNHDREEILTGLKQTVPNFDHIKNGAKNFGDFSVFFMDSFYETGGYGADIIERMEMILKQAVLKMKQWKNTRILLCHETLAPYPESVPDQIVEILKGFDFVFNGHMHFWNRNAYGTQSIISLPSLLPSRIVKGKYSTELYEWSAKETLFTKRVLRSPFGYVVVDTTSNEVDLRLFNPSKKIIEVELDGTGLSLEEARSRYGAMLKEIDARGDKKDLIVLPNLEGEVTFLPLYFESVKESFPNLAIEEVRSNRATLRSGLQPQVISAPTLSIDQLSLKVGQQIPKLVDELRSNGITIGEKSLRAVLRTLLDEDMIGRALSTPQIRNRLQPILSAVLEEIGDVVHLRRPENLEDMLTGFLRMVR